ncbi:MAG: glycosyltransferase [Cyanobacteria bacterium]|jgi:predicted glycosyltransferase|nr:glycosyltransferase [Cyanobacteria bacterium GSL.Bin1]
MSILQSHPLHPLESLQLLKKKSSQQRKWRIILYSHDTMGLGHKRRNLLIAQTLGISAINADILLISGMRDGNPLQTPAGIDYLTLPALYKNTNGQYQARRLDLTLKEIITLRSQIIRTAVQTFQPDVLIVDNVPRGAMGELNATLQYLRTQTQTRCILGLRDVLDEPKVIRRSWQRSNHKDAIRRYYDAVWVYGDPKIYNPIQDYGLSVDLTAKFRYTGYLDRRSTLQFVTQEQLQETLNLPNERLALCLLGGGQDGGQLAEAFVKTKFPPHTHGVIITGPMMPQQQRQQIQAYADLRSDLSVFEYVAEPALFLERADWVIAMGGYNTTCEILSFEKQALIVPRVRPRQEQLIRVQLLKKLGLVDMLHPDHLSPQSLSTWLHQEKSAPNIRQKIDFRGLERIPQFLAEMLEEPAEYFPSVVNHQ